MARRQGQKKKWTEEDNEKILALRDGENIGFPELARRFGVTRNAVCQRYHALKAGKAQTFGKDGKLLRRTPLSRPQNIGTHREQHDRARRGYHVPADRMDEYVDLLKQGLPIATVVERMKLA